MKKLTLLCLGYLTGSLILASGTAFADPKTYYYNHSLKAHETQAPINWLEWLRPSFLPQSLIGSDAPEPQATSGIFDQLLNPNDPTDPTRFKQRYFINSRFASGENSPVLYYVCGESQCDASDLYGEIVDQAQKYGAHMVALEHRYYGKSQPFGDLSAAHMKYLTIENALSDLASFQRFAMDRLGLKGKWVSMGGSYPGSLSAYYRESFPKLVSGALASSAPVHAKAAFEDYDLDVATVAGPECAATMRRVVKQVESVLDQPDQLAKIKALFDASSVRDSVDFLYVIADMAAIAIQYGHRDEFCTALQGADPLTSYATVGKKMFAWFGITAEQDSLQGAESEDVSLFDHGLGMRQWLYQSCREFGFFQVAYHDPAISVRSSLISLQYHFDACQRLFHLGPVSVDALNKRYYEPFLNESTTRILFTNGSTDPWSKISITPELGNNTNPHLSTYVIEGGAHCDDLGTKTDLPGYQEAREKFSSLLGEWLR
ncbi:S28 family serine protease [Bdellovibrionota bacterium FG-1]